VTGVDSIADPNADEPTVVSVRDVHGSRDRFQSALLTLADHPDVDPVVERACGPTGSDEAAGDGLRWVGGEEYVLVVNGDLVNRARTLRAVCPCWTGFAGRLRTARSAGWSATTT
jgi:hypothetical protein